MKSLGVVVLLGVLAVVSTGSTAVAESGHRVGAGVHYWRAVSDVDVKDVDKAGMAYMVSYQYDPGALLLFEANLEIFPEEMTGTSEKLFAPQAFVLVGGAIYAGLGAGYFYYDGDFSSDPFFVLRGGLNLEILPGIFLDANLNYHFTDLGDLKHVDEKVNSDTMTIGAALRIAL